MRQNKIFITALKSFQKVNKLQAQAFSYFGNAQLGLFSLTQYRILSGRDKLQNFGGGHPLNLNLGKRLKAD